MIPARTTGQQNGGRAGDRGPENVTLARAQSRGTDPAITVLPGFPMACSCTNLSRSPERDGATPEMGMWPGRSFRS